MARWIDLIGTTLNEIRITFTGVRLRNNSGNLLIRNAADNADASVTASTVNVSGDSLIINSDAANTGADRSITISRPTSGMAASYTLTLPTDDGSPSQVLQTDGNGVLSWVTAGGSNTDKLTLDTTSLAFGSGASVAMFTLPANAVVKEVQVVVDTAFNGTPSLSIGISGQTSKYFASTQVDLTAAATTAFENCPGLPSVGTTENLIASYTAGGASAGAARILVSYAIPA